MKKSGQGPIFGPWVIVPSARKSEFALAEIFIFIAFILFQLGFLDFVHRNHIIFIEIPNFTVILFIFGYFGSEKFLKIEYLLKICWYFLEIYLIIKLIWSFFYKAQLQKHSSIRNNVAGEFSRFVKKIIILGEFSR